jgi:uncharacterized membrane protein
MRIIPVFLGAVLGAGVSLLSGCGTHMGNSLTSNPPSNADFSLTASPSTLSLTAGASGQTISVTATALNGFTGSVSVSLAGLPAGMTASLSTLTLTPGAAQTLTLTAGSSAATGTATITFTGKSGADSHTTTVALTVMAAAAPDFSLTVAPPSVDLTAGASGQTVAVTANALNGFTGNVSVSVTGLPSGVTANPSSLTLTPGAPQNLILTAAASAAGEMTPITVTGTSGILTHTAPIALTVSAAAPAPDFSLTVVPASLSLTAGSAGKSVSVSANALNGFTGNVNLSVSGLPSGVTASPSMLTLAPGAAQSLTLTAGTTAKAGTATITLTGTSGGLTHAASVAVTISAAAPAPDFSVTIAPTNLSLTAGSAGKSVSVTANALNGFTGSVSVSLTGLPAGVIPNPSSLTLTPGIAQNLILTAGTSAKAGTATISLTGTSRSLTHTATIALTVSAAAPEPDFSLAVVPASLSLIAGSTGKSVSITANALNGFTSSVSVSLSGLPSGVTGSPSVLTLAPGTAKNLALTAGASAKAGTATITLTGTSGGLTHTTSIALTVSAAAPEPDFSLTVAPASLSLTAGSIGKSVSITANALNGFTGSVSVSLSGLPTGVIASPAILTLTPGTGRNLTLSAGTSAKAGTATITLTGKSGSLTHSAIIALTIAAAAATPDFSLTVAPANLSLTAGSTGKSVSVTANALNGFTGSVSVSLSGLSSGVAGSPSVLTLAPGTAQNLTLIAGTSAKAGMAAITLTGTSGSLTHTATIAVTIAAAPPTPDFSLAVAPATLGLTVGAAGHTVAVTANALNGFTSRVSVSASGLPAGVTASPSTLTLTPGIAQNLTLTAGTNAKAGTATITLTGTSGSLTQTATVTITINAAAPAPDFSLTVAPASLSLTAGSTGKSTSVTANALSGFTGSVSVSLSGLPAGVTPSPSSLTLSRGVAQNLTLTAGTSAKAGTATITLTGTSGSLTHTATIALTITAAAPAPDFSLSVTPASLTLTVGGGGQPTSVTANALNGFTGSVNLSLSGLPTGVTSSPSAPTLTPGTAQSLTFTAASNAAAGTPTITLTGTSGTLTQTTTLKLTVNAAAAAGVDVTTYHYDNARDGLNAGETTLTPANVNSAGFGKVGLYATDGKVDAAPLYLSGMTINGQTRNVLYVVSEHDSVYAFDADGGTQLWKISVLGNNETTSGDHNCGQISPEIGITATPVIDRSYGAHGAIFVVGITIDSSGNYHHRLHALDLTTGAELSGGPTEIQATYPGTGIFSNNGVQEFLPGQYAERVGLLLMNGTIYMGWTSHCDQAPYTGWLMAYGERTLQQTAVLNLTPNTTDTGNPFGEGEGSIWMAGAGLAGDGSNIYFLDANGGFDSTLDANGFPIHGDYGNAFMKVTTANGKLVVADYFNISNTVTESNDDTDLGSGGVLLLPDQTDSNGHVRQLAVGAGKDHSIYVADRNNMGKFNSVSNNIYQQLSGALANGEWGMPAWFNGTVYYGGQGDVMKAFSVVNAQLQATPSSQSAEVFSYPGTIPSVSANGTTNGIVWAVENSSGNGVLHAYDATNLGNELYNSNQAAGGRDSFTDNKFITPVVANGKVFVGTTTGVAVFGLLH